MRKIQPKRCVLGLVSTRPNQEIEVYLAERNFSLTGPTIHLNGQITEEEAINIIIKALLPSLKANNPKDARHGDGQYFTDLNPALYTSSQIARRLINIPNQYKYTCYIAIDVTGLEIENPANNMFIKVNFLLISVEELSALALLHKKEGVKYSAKI